MFAGCCLCGGQRCRPVGGVVGVNEVAVVDDTSKLKGEDDLQAGAEEIGHLVLADDLEGQLLTQTVLRTILLVKSLMLMMTDAMTQLVIENC